MTDREKLQTERNMIRVTVTAETANQFVFMITEILGN